jgi:uracil-DNA glycosylase
MLIDLLNEPSWQTALATEFKNPYIDHLYKFIKSEYDQYIVHPKWENILLALNLCPLNQVKVVILGQDPYHNYDQAMGLAFSVSEKNTLPPSLKNIFKEIRSDLRIETIPNGDLSRWAEQGVLLLNTNLTVRHNQANSHQKQGWEKFTNSVIKIISDQNHNIVFILWGKYAQSKKNLVNKNKHLVLESAHPSPLSANRGFFGCKHFSKTNEYLSNNKIKPINWQ